ETIWLEGEMRAGYAVTRLGEVPVAGESPSDTTRISVLIRPEQIVLGGQDEGTPATVIDRQFRGAHTLLKLDVSGLTLQLRSPAPPPCDAVFVHVASSCPVFRDPG